jgi:hypothetical protein
MNLSTKGISMKKHLGRIALLLLVLFTFIDAQEYQWSASINKESVYVNEAVHLHYRCEFDSRDELHVIEFDPTGKYEAYDIYLLSESENIEDGKRVNEFEFVAFVKKSGKIDFDFDVLMKKTNQDSIENTVLGRDNAGYEEFSKKLIKQKRLSLNVLPNNVKLVGEFDFSIKKDDARIDAYEPYHLEIVIEGVGNLDKLDALDLNISDAKVFSSKPEKKYSLTKGGYKGSWSQKFAIVAQNNIVIPEISYSYFSPKSKVVKSFKENSFELKVNKLYKKEELLDKEEPKEALFKKEYLYYLLFFLLGFLSAKIKIKTFKKNKQKDSFASKIDACKDIDELMVLLVINDSAKYANIIEKIEDKQIGLSQAKSLASNLK